MSCYTKQQNECEYTYSNRYVDKRFIKFCPYLEKYGWCDYGDYCYYRHYELHRNYDYNDKYSNYQISSYQYKTQDNNTKYQFKKQIIDDTEKKEKDKEVKRDDKWYEERNIKFVNNTKQQEFENIIDDELAYYIKDIFYNLTKEELNNLNKKRNIIWLLGLPGAGKSTTINYLLNESKICNDYESFSINDIISQIKSENNNKFIVKEQYRLIIKHILSNSNNIIIDSFFKSPQHYTFIKLFHNMLKKYYSNIKFVFLYLDCDLNTSIKRQLSRANNILNRKPNDKNNKFVLLKISDLKKEDCEYRSNKSFKKLNIITNYLWNDPIFYYNFIQVNVNKDFKYVKKDILAYLKQQLYF